MPIGTFSLGPLQTNSYLLATQKNAVVIDVGGDPAEILKYLTSHSLTLSAICITHLHFDHVYGVAALAKATNAPVFAPAGDAPIADTEAAKGGIWGLPLVPAFQYAAIPLGETSFADIHFRVLSTPGHTPGSVSLYFPSENAVFSGDALFYRSVGRTDFPLGDTQTLLTSIKTQLFTLPDATIVYPGHGPETSIGDEKANNPYCGDFSA